MINIGITGQHGFVGHHLFNTLGLFPDEFIRVPFERNFFDDEKKLASFVSECDIIIHLAALNRHNESKHIYDTNIDLVRKLVSSLRAEDHRPHVIFSSSSQELRDNPYGKSKKEGREIFLEWSKDTGAKFTGLVIPNVYGPFGHPYYNSFIATFCHQLTHQEQPLIDVDGGVKLIYVADLVKRIIEEIRAGEGSEMLTVPHTHEYKVSEILMKLEGFKEKYLMNGIIPSLSDNFEYNLFNTLRSYIDLEEHYPVKFVSHIDPRGVFVEIIRLNVGGQVSFSTTVPGVTRGNHFHTRKIERFAVIKGKALIQLRKIGTAKIIDFHLDGDESSYVDMPVWYTHNIKNVGDEDLYTIFWINEFYDPNDPDTYFENVY